MTGTVIEESTKGFSFIETDETHQSVFCHISQVNGSRCLHRGDRVRFELIPNPVRRNDMMAGKVEFMGRVADAGRRP
jgi:cold shock CspA family protein